MPDTPPDAVHTSTAPSVSPTSVGPASLTTNNGKINAMNGLHSPISALNGSRGGRTPSPNSAPNNSSQQLPPACGARQLSKLKRFLTTLQQFGSDISPEIGERVRTLVLGLVNSHLSIEEFHAKLQEATNFPLRPFVIPFLKANLPLLQRELLHCARMAKQTPQQYLAHNEHILFDPAHALPDSDQIQNDLNENGKRRASSPGPERVKESESHSDVHPAKRHQTHPISPGGNHRVSPNGPIFNHNNNFGPIRLEDISMSREMRERERAERESRERIERERYERERERHYSNSSFNSYHRDTPLDHLDRQEDEWKHIENMLHCIVSMVDKTKRALGTLQERSQRDREELALWMRRQSDADHDIKKREPYNRNSDERISEVKRRAEEAVNEVKRQAVIELQKAVAAAEQKANELVTAEKVKMDRSIAEVKKKAREEVMGVVNRQEESTESCWNCGRKANETCSGCNVARYCGSFCQHKDWESHHRVCGQNAAQERGSSKPSASPPTSIPVSRPVSTPPVASPANSHSSTASAKGSRSNTPDDAEKPDKPDSR